MDIFLRNLNLVKIGQKYEVRYIKTYVSLELAALNLYQIGLVDRSGTSLLS